MTTRTNTRAATTAAQLGPVPALLALVACTTTSARLQPQDLAGCYYFDRNPAAEEMRLPGESA